jgi:hypothetical protein
VNPANHCRLEGVVQSFPLYGDNWTRYNRHQRGQVRFWLGVTRELAGEGLDLLLCAIEPNTAEELRHYQDEIRGGRTVLLEAHAKAVQPAEIPGESTPGVVFVAESCGFGGHPAQPVHHKLKPSGKMAAAGDDSELPLQT